MTTSRTLLQLAERCLMSLVFIFLAAVFVGVSVTSHSDAGHLRTQDFHVRHAQ